MVVEMVLVMELVRVMEMALSKDLCIYFMQDVLRVSRLWNI